MTPTELRERLRERFLELILTNEDIEFTSALINDVVELRAALSEAGRLMKSPSAISEQSNERMAEALTASDIRLKSLGVL